MPFDISDAIRDGTVRVSLGGELDLAAVPAIRETLRRHLDGAAAEVVVDLSRATFIDSVAVGAFVGCRNHARTAGKRLRIVGSAGMVRQVLDTMGLTDLFARG